MNIEIIIEIIYLVVFIICNTFLIVTTIIFFRKEKQLNKRLVEDYRKHIEEYIQNSNKDN